MNIVHFIKEEIVVNWLFAAFSASIHCTRKMHHHYYKRKGATALLVHKNNFLSLVNSRTFSSVTGWCSLTTLLNPTTYASNVPCFVSSSAGQSIYVIIQTGCLYRGVPARYVRHGRRELQPWAKASQSPPSTYLPSNVHRYMKICRYGYRQW